MSNRLLVAVFDDEHDLIEASHKLRKADIKIHDFYTPFPVHGLDDLLDIKRTRLPMVTFVAGGIGLTLAMGFQIWTSAFDWPINVGGKPMLSIPAFAPVAFEIMVLLGALCTVAAFFFVAKLYPSKEVIPLHVRQLDDKFLAVIKNPKGDVAENILKEHHAVISYSEQGGNRS